MRERRRDYELMFIISPLRASEEDITTTISRVHQAVANAGGAVTDTEQGAPWGRRKFAYPIREYAEGQASRGGGPVDGLPRPGRPPGERRGWGGPRRGGVLQCGHLE